MWVGGWQSADPVTRYYHLILSTRMDQAPLAGRYGPARRQPSGRMPERCNVEDNYREFEERLTLASSSTTGSSRFGFLPGFGFAGTTHSLLGCAYSVAIGPNRNPVLSPRGYKGLYNTAQKVFRMGCECGGQS